MMAYLHIAFVDKTKSKANKLEVILHNNKINPIVIRTY